jgi:protein-L-isoaspartate(D-aspartate) O-methyltransferase
MRRRLVEHLRRRGLVHDPRVAGAFLAVPREVFLPETLARSGMGAVYQDDAIVTRRDPATMAPLSSSSQPAIMAIMLELLELRPGHRVLEIGAGTGYNAALLARLVDPDGLVVTLDIDPEIAEAAAGALRRFATGVHVVVGGGAGGRGGGRPASWSAGPPAPPPCPGWRSPEPRSTGSSSRPALPPSPRCGTSSSFWADGWWCRCA